MQAIKTKPVIENQQREKLERILMQLNDLQFGQIIVFKEAGKIVNWKVTTSYK